MEENDYFVHESSYIDTDVKIGKGTKIWHFCHIQSGASIGENCSLGQNVNIGNNVKIGNDVKIQNNVSVYEGVELEDGVFCGPSCVFTNDLTPRARYPKGRENYKKTIVREGATIGANATIVCGNIIGKNSMVAAGAVVTKDVPPGMLVSGVPAKAVRHIAEYDKKNELKKAKICHLTTVHNRHDIRILKKECTSLAQIYEEVILLVNDLLEEEFIGKVHIKSIDYPVKNRIQRIFSASNKMLKEALNIDADLYQIHDPELLPAAWKLKKKGKMVIFDSHENYSVQIMQREYIPAVFRKSIAAIYNKLETIILKRLDGVITPCTFKGVNPYSTKCKRSILVNNYPLGEEIKAYGKIESKKEKGAVCYVGSLEYIRGTTHLIKAAYKANVKLILAGNFSSKEYETEVKNMPEYACVDFRGYLDREEVKKVYEDSDIGMCTLLLRGQHGIVDTLPTKAYEYMAAGLPVIIQKNRFSETMIKKYEFGLLVDPENEEEIAKAILELLQNRELAKSLGKNGKALVSEKFTWDVEKKKLFAMYNEILVEKNSVYQL